MDNQPEVVGSNQAAGQLPANTDNPYSGGENQPIEGNNSVYQAPTNQFAYNEVAPAASQPLQPIPAENEAATPAKKQDSWVNFGLKLVIMVAIVLLFTQYIVPPYVVNGQSMEPNYHTGDRVITDQAVFKLLEKPQRDEVVILKEPQTGEVLIKRVIGLPGDTVQIRNNTVYVNGTPLDEPFIQFKTDYYFGPLVVPPNQYFVMGDNRSNSLDSHIFGPVPSSDIVARVLFTLF